MGNNANVDVRAATFIYTLGTKAHLVKACIARILTESTVTGASSDGWPSSEAIFKTSFYPVAS